MTQNYKEAIASSIDPSQVEKLTKEFGEEVGKNTFNGKWVYSKNKKSQADNNVSNVTTVSDKLNNLIYTFSVTCQVTAGKGGVLTEESGESELAAFQKFITKELKTIHTVIDLGDKSE